MKKIFFIILLVPFFCHAQKRNNIWCFGDSAGIDFNDPLNPIPFYTSLDTRGSCVSICDTSGNLLFYSFTRAAAGCWSSQVFDKSHQLMDNGDSIIGTGWYNELMIIPKPGSDSEYYLLTIGSCNLPARGLFYSTIDLRLNNGLGAVAQKNIMINQQLPVDALAAVKHANGRDWWLIYKKWNPDNGFYIYLITPSGVTLYSIQFIGGDNSSNVGNFTFSINGEKLLFTSYSGLIEVLDFDRCLGQFNNPIIIENEVLANPVKRYWGSALSGDVTKIFVSNSDSISYLFQYDLNAPIISLSKDTLFAFNNVIIEGGALRLAPDNKIYITNAWNDGVNFNYPYPTDSTSYNFINMNLGVVNSPDSLGVGCDFQPYSFYLGGKRTYWGLPNNPNYDLGPVSGSVCDSLQVGIPTTVASSINQLKIFPSPVSHTGEVTFTYNTLHEPGEISVYNIDGKRIAFYTLPQWSSIQRVRLPELSRGIYLAKMTSGISTTSIKFVVM